MSQDTIKPQETIEPVNIGVMDDPAMDRSGYYHRYLGSETIKKACEQINTAKEGDVVLVMTARYRGREEQRNSTALGIAVDSLMDALSDKYKENYGQNLLISSDRNGVFANRYKDLPTIKISGEIDYMYEGYSSTGYTVTFVKEVETQSTDNVEL